MLRKLRIKFIAIIMASVAAVLVVVFTGICVSEYQRSMSNVDEALANAVNRAVESAGGLGWRDRPDGGEGAPSDDWASSKTPDDRSSSHDGLAGTWADGTQVDDSRADGAQADGAQVDDSRADGVWADGARAADARSGSAQAMGPRIGGMGGGERSLVPVAVYTVTEQSELQVVGNFTTAAIDSDVLASAQERTQSTADGVDTMDDLGLRYHKRTVDDTTYIAFADTASAGSWRSLAFTLGVAAVVVLAVFLVIALLFSRWALRPVQEAWDSQRQFVADASHELKTPLTVVLANTSILLKHPEKSIAEQSQWVESTQIEAENMQGLVNEMLELAQVESRANVHHEPVDFSDLVDVEVLQFESVAFERGCRFEDDVAQGVCVNGDAARLRKMTSTLIENALKYVDERGEVDVRLACDGRAARLSIRNTGSTIAPDDLPHIFDRFYRTDKARTSGAGGFGLGLAIAREIAREHGGDIACTSTPQDGTTFTVTLPLAPQNGE